MNRDIFEEELKELDKNIRLGYNAFRFKVSSLEASSGKTRQIIASAIKTKREMLIVTKFKTEVDRIVTEINKGAGFAKACGIVSDVELVQNNQYLVLSAREIEFFQYGVIVITHSQYYKLCKGENDYLEGLVRHFETLLIDEEFNPIKNNLYTFTLKRNEEMKELFTSFGLGENIKELTNILENQFSKKEYKPSNQLHWIKLNEDSTYIKNKCEILRNLINKDNENISVKLIDYKNNTNKSCCISDITDYIDLIEKIIVNSLEGYSLIDVNEKVIATYNYDFQFFKLKNNIMLDASASFSELYKSDKFEVVSTKRKIDHSKCKLTVVNIKTTTSGKSKINHLFRPRFKNYVVKALGDSESGLIVTKKDEAEYLEYINFVDFDKEVKDEIEMLNSDLFNNIEYEERISFCNYENQRGRNDYADYKHCFLAHTYRQPRFYYVFLYRYFFNVKATEEEMQTINKKGENGLTYWGFHNCERLQQLMITDMLSCQYQSLKRVARNREPEAHYHIFTNDVILIELLLKELNGFNMKNFNVIQEVEFLGERVSKRSKKDILKDYIEERLAQGKWQRVKSSDLKKSLGISDKTWREIWKDEDFLAFCKGKRIKEGKPKGQKVNSVYKY
ncbi:hypothetical protein [Clostridium saudiense]|uniref:hypothetical protein n=1 Tax=Clostridium saudiense TaxID=1414720 RepID=UPI000822FFF6|nr:hypothetical protein [Clostridium saudiense]MDU7455124.1 hypothetical protein [Clostridium saudiense]SCJ16697.1 Uncharacterised protein [uncultured Clostridium sp.]